MSLFLSCFSAEFKSYPLRLANQLGALKDHPYDIKVQEDFQQGVLKGGHFAALKQPDLLVADIRKFFAKIDQK